MYPALNKTGDRTGEPEFYVCRKEIEPQMVSAQTCDGLYERLVKGEKKLALIGLGYVGMPIAVEFAKHVKVIGFNHNEKRIQQYKSGIDPTHEVVDEAIQTTTVDFTSDEKRLSEAKIPYCGGANAH